MVVRNILLAASFVMAIVVGLGTVQADTTNWDAVADFHTTGNDASATWQYLSSDVGSNSGYTLYPTYQVETAGPTYPVWTDNTSWHFVGMDPSVTTELRVHPELTVATAIGWKSPITGTVSAAFSLTDRNSGGAGGMASNTGCIRATSPRHCTTARSTTAAQAARSTSRTSPWRATTCFTWWSDWPNSNSAADLTGVTFTVKTVPEPGTLACRPQDYLASWPTLGEAELSGESRIANGGCGSNVHPPFAAPAAEWF